MISKRKYLNLNICLLLALSVQAQQQPMFTQYMFNPLVINPAYAGSQETFTATGVFRKQWLGIDDAPATQTLSAHSPVDGLRKGTSPGTKVSLGLTLINDRIAISNQTGLFASYAYRLKMRTGANLSLGLQAGVSQFRIQYSRLALDDPAFATGDVVEWTPNFGAGILYHTHRFYAGLSAPHMLRNIRRLSNVGFVPQYFLSAGYVLSLSDALQLKPNVLIRSIRGNPLQADLNLNAFLERIIEVGISWRSYESLGALGRIQITQKFSIGYSYDMPMGSEISE